MPTASKLDKKNKKNAESIGQFREQLNSAFVGAEGERDALVYLQEVLASLHQPNFVPSERFKAVYRSMPPYDCLVEYIYKALGEYAEDQNVSLSDEQEFKRKSIKDLETATEKLIARLPLKSESRIFSHLLSNLY